MVAQVLAHITQAFCLNDFWLFTVYMIFVTPATAIGYHWLSATRDH
jgi:hypothetical protein